MNSLRTSVLGLALVAMVVALVSPVQGQPYKETFNEGLEAAKAANLPEARSKFLEASTGAQEADDAETLRKANYYVAQINSRLGNSALKDGNFENALYLFQEGLEKYPDFIRNQYGAGQALKRLGRMDEALDAWKLAADAQGDRKTSLAAENAIRDHFIYQASSSVSKSNAMRADADRALTALEEMLTYVEADADYHYYRAVSLYIIGQYGDAVAAADQALAMHNGSRADAAKIHFTRGEALVGTGDREAAKEAFTNAAFGSYRASAEHYLSTL